VQPEKPKSLLTFSLPQSYPIDDVIPIPLGTEMADPINLILPRSKYSRIVTSDGKSPRKDRQKSPRGKRNTRKRTTKRKVWPEKFVDKENGRKKRRVHYTQVRPIPRQNPSFTQARHPQEGLAARHCSLCFKVYYNAEMQRFSWIRCSSCSGWTHVRCYEATFGVRPSDPFFCTFCVSSKKPAYSNTTVPVSVASSSIHL